MGGKWAKMAKAAKRRLPKAPPELEYLLIWYEEMRAGMARGMHHEPLSHGEMLAYFTLYKIDWDAFDVETLRMMDAIWRKALPKPDET